MINLRASQKQKRLIDRAAELLGRTRSDFMLETACREAETVLLDGRYFGLSPDTFKRFTAMLDKPPASNPKLRRLLQTKAPWPLMTTKTLDQHIETSLGVAGGKPRIAGHRITVLDIVIWHERLGKSVDEIASDYGLTLADVHAALAYYFDHRADIDKDTAEGQAFAESLRQATPSKLKHKLNAGEN
ncbi:MAG: DUF1778 domain-containing protein [Nitrospira sp.]|nr:DUF1778 domain-containing protein [Nitrospira sp.]